MSGGAVETGSGGGRTVTLGSRVIGPELAVECARAFLGATFSGEPRHRRRLGKVLAIEAEEVST